MANKKQITDLEQMQTIWFMAARYSYWFLLLWCSRTRYAEGRMGLRRKPTGSKGVPFLGFTTDLRRRPKGQNQPGRWRQAQRRSAAACPRGQSLAWGRLRLHGLHVTARPETFCFHNREVLLKKTNAARASHPSRIVIADVLTAVLRFRGGSSRNHTLESAMHRCLPEACASGYDSALPSFLEEEL